MLCVIPYVTLVTEQPVEFRGMNECEQSFFEMGICFNADEAASPAAAP